MLTDKSLTLYNLSQKSSINVIFMGHSLYIIDLMNIGLKLFFWGGGEFTVCYQICRIMFSFNYQAPIEEMLSTYTEQKSKLMDNNKISVIDKNNIYHYLLFINCNLEIKLNKQQKQIPF